MRRREFITVLGGAAVAWPLAARAQQPAMPVVGFVSGRSTESSAGFGAVFRKALNEAGYVEGQNVMVEYHWLDGQYERLPALMAELVHSRVAVIVTPGFGAGARAAKAATTTIWIVFGVAEDPVKLGLVASLARPGGNATGINLLSAEVGAKRLGLLHDLVPKAVRIAVLVNPANSSTAEATLRDIPEAHVPWMANSNPPCRHQPRDRSGLRHPRARPGRCSLRRPRHVLHQPARPIRDARGAQCDSRGLFQPLLPGGGRANELRDRILDYYRHAGVYTGQILRGAKPADLPVFQSTKWEFVINLQTARALGLDVPNSIQLLADELIE